jgi:hypothetical protein
MADVPAAARVRSRVWSCGICGGQSGAGAGFLRVLRFPLQIFIPPIASQSPSSIIWDWYNRPVVATVPSGLSFTPLRIMKKKSDIPVVVRTKYLLNTIIALELYHFTTTSSVEREVYDEIPDISRSPS